MDWNNPDYFWRCNDYGDKMSNKRNNDTNSEKTNIKINNKINSKTIIISLGGSIIVPREIDVEYLKEFQKLISDIKKNFDKIIIVAGGGHTARTYQNASDNFNVNDDDKDWIGIAATRINAELLRSILNDCYEEIVQNPNNPPNTKKKIIVGSGHKPGVSTDYDAYLLAKYYNADTIINLSNIDYVYDKDPKKHKDAKKIEYISWNEFMKLVGDTWIPGANFPFDPIASKACMEAKIKVKILNGKDINNIKKCLLNERFIGTIIE